MKIQAIGGSLNRQKQANFKGYFDGEITKGRKTYTTYDVTYHDSYSSTSIRVDRAIKDIQKVFVPYSWDRESDYPKTAEVPLNFIYVDDMNAVKSTKFYNDVHIAPILTRTESLKKTIGRREQDVKNAEESRSDVYSARARAASDMNAFYLFNSADKKKEAKRRYEYQNSQYKTADLHVTRAKADLECARKEIDMATEAEKNHKLLEVSNLRGEHAISVVMDFVAEKVKTPGDTSWIKDEVVSFPRKTMLLSDVILIGLGLEEKEISELSQNTKSMIIASHIKNADFLAKVEKIVSKHTF